jgi:hypothetical protein
MKALSLGAVRVEEALRVVSSLGAHRYLAGRAHLVHVFGFAAAQGADGRLDDGRKWAIELLGGGGPDPRSTDEAVWRRSTEAEVVALLDAFWTPGERATASRRALRAVLEAHDLALAPHAPFEESVEPTIHPLLVDAGWELLPLSELDPDRHKGAIAAFGDLLAFASACMLDGEPVLLELPALGPNELLHGAGDDGTLCEPLVVWAQGNETYVDYVVRGVRRAAKLA